MYMYMYMYIRYDIIVSIIMIRVVVVVVVVVVVCVILLVWSTSTCVCLVRFCLVWWVCVLWMCWVWWVVWLVCSDVIYAYAYIYIYTHIVMFIICISLWGLLHVLVLPPYLAFHVLRPHEVAEIQTNITEINWRLNNNSIHILHTYNNDTQSIEQTNIHMIAQLVKGRLPDAGGPAYACYKHQTKQIDISVLLSVGCYI